LTGGGKQKVPAAGCSEEFSLTTVCREIKKQAVLAASYVRRFFLTTVCRKIRTFIPLNTKGSIIIEFAVCMPVLIILLFYIHDLSRLKRYYDQTEFVAQQMVNILQNIAYSRAQEGSTISVPDIERAASLAYLSIYPGTTMFTTKSGSQNHVLNHQPRIYMYYVESNGDGTASTVWNLWLRSGSYTTPTSWSNSYLTSNDHSLVSLGTDVPPSSIYPSLKMDDGKPRIILDVQLRWGSDQRDADGKTAASAREVFKFLTVNPTSKAVSDNGSTYFPAVVTFTPNAGFSRTRPQ